MGKDSAARIELGRSMCQSHPLLELMKEEEEDNVLKSMRELGELLILS